jgi:hypothetical protein
MIPISASLIILVLPAFALAFAVPSFGELLAFLALLVVGLLLIMVIGALIFLLPAVILAVVVWFLTGSVFWAGVVFLVIAVISLLKKR